MPSLSRIRASLPESLPQRLKQSWIRVSLPEKLEKQTCLRSSLPKKKVFVRVYSGSTLVVVSKKVITVLLQTY